jgi:DNA-binding NtrC family response regulator
MEATNLEKQENSEIKGYPHLIHLEKAKRKPKKIFVVEDDHACETVLRRVIRSIDPQAKIDWLESAEDAFQLMTDEENKGKTYDLIIADIFLAGKSTGLDLWRACHELYPLTPMLLTSGLQVDRFLETVGKETVAPPYLPKPFYLGECQQVIKGLLTYRN